MAKKAQKNNSPKESKYSIVCVGCKESKKVRPDVFDKRASKAGSITKLRESYLCRDCRKDEK